MPPRRQNEVKAITGEQGDKARSESGYSAADELDANKGQQIKEDLGVENLDQLERAPQHKNKKTSKSNLG